MKNRKLRYTLEYVEELYVKAKKECMDDFIYEARSLYTLVIAHTQSYNFTFDEIEDHVRALEYKIKLTQLYSRISCKEYLELIKQIRTEIEEAKQREVK